MGSFFSLPHFFPRSEGSRRYRGPRSGRAYANWEGGQKKEKEKKRETRRKRERVRRKKEKRGGEGFVRRYLYSCDCSRRCTGKKGVVRYSITSFRSISKVNWSVVGRWPMGKRNLKGTSHRRVSIYPIKDPGPYILISFVLFSPSLR